MSYVTALLVALAFGLILFVYLRRINPATVGVYKSRDWCEAQLAGSLDPGRTHPSRVPEQPVNTYSNLVYAAVGVFVALELATLPAFVFSLTMVVLCWGSSLYHALSTVRTGRFDVAGMYVVYSGLAVYAISMATGVPDWWIAVAMVVITSLFGLGGYFIRGWYHDNVNWKIAIFLIVPYLLVIERIVTHGQSDAILPVTVSFGLFAIAMISWIFDKTCRFPIRTWGHGVWHLFTGVATGMLFIAVYNSL